MRAVAIRHLGRQPSLALGSGPHVLCGRSPEKSRAFFYRLTLSGQLRIKSVKSEG